jgi:hypothetical protein
MQVPAVSDNARRQSHMHEDDTAASEDDQSDDGVFFASKIIDDQAVAGSNQVGGWSTFLEENMSSSAASEVDHGSGSDAGGEFGHDSSSLKNAFQDTLAKVTSSSTTAGLASVSVDVAEEKSLSRDSAPLLGSNSADRFSQQQPLTHTSASRQSFLQSVPAAHAISLIPVASPPPLSESFDSHSALQESADLKQVCKENNSLIQYFFTSCFTGSGISCCGSFVAIFNPIRCSTISSSQISRRTISCSRYLHSASITAPGAYYAQPRFPAVYAQIWRKSGAIHSPFVAFCSSHMAVL